MRKIYFLILGAIAFLPQTALAVSTEFGEVNNIAEYVNKIMTWLLPIVAGIALLAIIFAGYKYITSQGNPEAINQAKDIIISTITGVVLLLLIKIIINQIGIKDWP